MHSKNKQKNMTILRLTFFIALLAICADVFANGGSGTLGDSFKRGADNVPNAVLLARWIFGFIGFVIAGMGILAFFKKGQPPETGKNLGMILGGALLFALPWLISTTTTSVAGSDQSAEMQDLIIE